MTVDQTTRLTVDQTTRSDFEFKRPGSPATSTRRATGSRPPGDAGDRPRIEDFVGSSTNPGRCERLRHLLAVEFAYRGGLGETHPGVGVSTSVPRARRADRLHLRRAPPTALGGERAAPQAFGPFRVAGVIGRGGMGIVYRAVHEVTGQEVAVKTVRFPRLGLLQKLRREVHVLARLSHPGLVRVVEVSGSGAIPGTRWSLAGTDPR